MEYLNFEEANCQNCYKCLRTCKIKAIEIKDKQAKIIPSLCVGCGECFKICPQNAKSVRTDIEQVKSLLNEGENIVVSLAPSFPSFDNMNHPNQFIAGLKKLGFTQIEETTIGAFYVSNQYQKDYESDKKHIITSSCPTVNFLITKYYHDKVEYLSKVVSPMMVHSKIIKARETDVYTVFIGPCISKKEETKVCDSKGSCIDYVITFDDIREWFEEEKVDYKNLEPLPFDRESTQKTRWYPLSGGVEKASVVEDTYRRTIKVDGMKSCIELLDHLDDIDDKTWIEMNACEEGCINGYGNSTSPLSTQKKIENVISYINHSKDESKEKAGDIDISYDYTNFDTIMPHQYDEATIRNILIKTGKYTVNDELNCGACGYDSCRDKAKAVLDGKAELDMCIPYMRMISEDINNVIIENTPNAIIVVNNKFEIIEFNPSSVQCFMLSKKNAIGKEISEILGENIFINPIKNENKTLKKTLKKVGKTMIISTKHIEKHDLYLGIFKDITRDEILKTKHKNQGAEALEMAQEVIDKQMIIAHEIASLLGETTAETKVTLSKLKKLFDANE